MGFLELPAAAAQVGVGSGGQEEGIQEPERGFTWWPWDPDLTQLTGWAVGDSEKLPAFERLSGQLPDSGVNNSRRSFSIYSAPGIAPRTSHMES